MNKKFYQLILLLLLSSTASYSQTAVALPPQSSTYSGIVRGYYFTSPVDFTICGIYVPTDASVAAQSMEIVRFTAGPPPAYPGTTNAFTNLFYQALYAPNNMISVNVPVANGDVMGIYGCRGVSVNSYGSPNPAPTTIMAAPVSLYRSGMQFDLSTQTMHDIWTEAFPNSNYIGRVFIYYGCCNAPTGGTLTGPVTVCPGSTQTYQVNGVDSATNFTWTVPAGATINTGQGDSIITVTFGNTSGQVCVTPSNACTSAPQICINVAVDPPILGGVVVGDTDVCSGSVHTYRITNITGATTYAWTVPPGSTILSGQGDTLITVAIEDTSGNVCVTPATACNVGAPICRNINVVPSPNVTSPTSANTSCSGNDGTITLNGLVPNTTYTVEYLDSMNSIHLVTIISNGSGAVIIGGLIAGVYDSVTAQLGPCISSPVGPFTITAPYVPPPPVVDQFTYCQFETAPPLTATIATAGDTLVWYTTLVGGVGTTTAPVPNTSTPGTTTWYVAERAAVGGCESYRSVINVYIKPKPTPPVTFNSEINYCQYDSAAQLVAIGDSLKWYTQPTGGTFDFVAPTPQTDVNGVFTWYVSQTQNGCESDRIPITVGVYQKPEPPVTKDIVYCQGDVAEPLTAIGTDIKWYLLPHGGSAQTTPTPLTTIPDTVIWYVASTNHGCESDRTPLKVITKYRPSVHILYSNDSVCQFDTLTYMYSGYALDSAVFVWEWPEGAVVLSGNDSTRGPIVVRFDSTGPKRVALTVTDNGCSSPRATVPVEVKVLPVVQIDLSNRNPCKDDTVKIGINYSNMDIKNYWWNFGDGITPWGSSGVWGADEGGPYYITWPTTGIHSLTVHLQGKNECYSRPDAIDTVNIHDRPEAKIQDISNNNICSGDSISLAASTNKPGYSYEWTPKQFFDFGGGNTAVVNAYVEFSSYITLRVTNEYGCFNVDSTLISTKPCCDILMPDAFSPNGDGKNDLFRIIDLGRHPLSDFRIFNRWGEIVFDTTDPMQGWDGSHEGVSQDMGTYYYIVKFKCNGELTTKSGQLTLIR